MANCCLPSTQLFEPGSRQAPLPSMLMAIPFLIRTAGERRAGELAALIRVEDLRLAIAGESVLKRLDSVRLTGRGCAAARYYDSRS